VIIDHLANRERHFSARAVFQSLSGSERAFADDHGGATLPWKYSNCLRPARYGDLKPRPWAAR
jgi:hypothetical protein